jgi:transcriptional regulator with XRE-family HTH domain
MSDSAILQELSRRFKELRLRRDTQQKELAENSGVSLGFIQRFERGENISVLNLLKIMRQLDLLENLEQLIPEQPISPMLLKKIQMKKSRKRASNKS